MLELKTLYQDKQIKLTSDGVTYNLEHIIQYVLILPYTVSENGYPDKLGVIGNKEPFIPVTIQITDADSDIFSTAKRGLNEITGFRMEETDNWEFLGLIESSNYDSSGVPSFSVNITGLIAEENQNNDNIDDFSLVKVSQALDCDNAIIHSLFLKTFQFKLLNNNSTK